MWLIFKNKMNLKDLEYANFAIKSIIEDKPLESFVYHNALNGISDFLKSKMTKKEREIVSQNITTLNGVVNILKRYNEGGSCIREIIEINYSDLTKVVDRLNKIN